MDAGAEAPFPWFDLRSQLAYFCVLDARHMDGRKVTGAAFE